MEYHQEINLEFITVCGDIQQSSKAHGLTYQILQWGYTATVCVRVYVHVCVHVCMHACVCMCACLCLHVCACTHMQTQTRTHTQPHTGQGNSTVASWPMLSISHHHWFTNILATWTELSTDVHQTLLTCSGDVIHP